MHGFLLSSPSQVIFMVKGFSCPVKKMFVHVLNLLDSNAVKICAWTVFRLEVRFILHTRVWNRCQALSWNLRINFSVWWNKSGKKEKNFEGGVMFWIYNRKESNQTEGFKALWRNCLSTCRVGLSIGSPFFKEILWGEQQKVFSDFCWILNAGWIQV